MQSSKRVGRNWDTSFTENTFMDFKRKIKQVKQALTKWSIQVHADIFQQLLIREKISILKEKFFEDNPTKDNRIVMKHPRFSPLEIS